MRVPTPRRARPQRIMGDATVLLSILPKETWYYQWDAHEVRGLEPRWKN